MPFKSRKQQQWYNATNQDYLDDKPSSHRKVEESGWDETKDEHKIQMIKKLGLNINKHSIAKIIKTKFNDLSNDWQTLLVKQYEGETGGDISKLSDDELLKSRDYVYGTYKGLPYLRKLEAEIKNRGLGNPNYLEDWKKEDRSIPKSFFRTHEKLDDIWSRFYKEGEEQSEAPDQPFTLRRYIRDKSYSQLPTEIRGNTINLAQQGQGEEAKQPIGLRSMGKYIYVESGKISRSKEKKHDHICEKLKNTVWEMKQMGNVHRS